MSNVRNPSSSESQPDPGLAHWGRELQRFVEAGGNTTHAFGLGQMIGRMFVTLYLSPRPLALEEIAERLHVSKASASTVVRQLAGWHAVRQVWVPGDRRDYYEAETSFAVIIREGLLPGLRKKLQSAGVQIDRTLQAMPPPAQQSVGAPVLEDLTKEERQEVLRRLRAAQTVHRRLDRVLSSKLLDHLI